MPGFGPAKFAQLQAVLELASRAVVEEMRRDALLNSPDGFATTCASPWPACRTKCSSALFLDSQNRLIAAEELFRGTLAQTSVYPREVVKRALAHNAAAVIFAHNHPSGVAEPCRRTSS